VRHTLRAENVQHKPRFALGRNALGVAMGFSGLPPLPLPLPPPGGGDERSGGGGPGQGRGWGRARGGALQGEGALICHRSAGGCTPAAPPNPNDL